MDFPAESTDVTYQMTVSGTALKTPVVTPLRFASSLPATPNVDYLLLTSRRLHGPAVERMAAYRRSREGGNSSINSVKRKTRSIGVARRLLTGTGKSK